MIRDPSASYTTFQYALETVDEKHRTDPATVTVRGSSNRKSNWVYYMVVSAAVDEE